jgi:hypothetical protein
VSFCSQTPFGESARVRRREPRIEYVNGSEPWS